MKRTWLTGIFNNIPPMIPTRSNGNRRNSSVGRKKPHSSGNCFRKAKPPHKSNCMPPAY